VRTDGPNPWHETRAVWQSCFAFEARHAIGIGREERRQELQRQITEFGDRATFIARRVSWSSDGRSILAAVAEGDSDIVLLEGLTNVGRE
jgi:hypothetical protein